MSEKLTYENIDPNVRRLIMIGMSIAMFASCFDGTIIPILQVKITQTWAGSSELVPLMMTAYMLFETLMIPVSGKLSDQYGRKKLFIIGTILFTVGSVVGALAFDPWMLIIGRAIQGAGGGTIIPVATAAVADLYAPEHRGQMQGVLGAIFGIGMGIGPVIGGVLATIDLGAYESWRLAFWINVPIAIASILMTKKEFPEMDSGISKAIDYRGLTLLMALLLTVILYFELVNKYFAFNSVESFALIALAFILVISFVKVEMKAEEAIIAPHIFSNRTVTQSIVLYFFCGFALVGIELFSNFYSQSVIGMEVLESGMYIVILVIGMTATALLTGRMVNRTGSKVWIVFGCIITVIGLFMFANLDTTGPTSTRWYYGLVLFIFGFGTGAIITPVITAVQNSCKESEVGMTTSSVNLFRNIGATVSTTIFSMIAAASIRTYSMDFLPAEFAKRLGDQGLAIIEYVDVGKLQKLFEDMVIPPETCEILIAGIKKVYTYAIDISFAVAAIAGVAMLVVALIYKDVKYEKKDDEGKE